MDGGQRLVAVAFIAFGMLLATLRDAYPKLTALDERSGNLAAASALAATLGVTALGSAVWRVWGTQLGARLVFHGVLSVRHARRRPATAVALLVLRSAETEAPRLELEDCIGDKEAKSLAIDIEKFCVQGRVLGSLCLHRCIALSHESLNVLLGAVSSKGSRLLELDLAGCSGLGDSAAELVGGLLLSEAHELRFLGLARCGITAAGVSALGAVTAGVFPPLPSSGPKPAAHSPLAAPLAPPAAEPAKASPAAPGLRALQLSGNSLAGAGRALAALVRAWTKLEIVGLEGCALSFDDVQKLAGALPRSTVHRLDLADNGLRSKGLLSLAGVLRLSKIQDLGLERNEIGVGEALAALKDAHDRRPFRSIRLAGNKLTASQQAMFLRSLRTTPSDKGKFGWSGCPPGCGCFEGRGEVM